MLSKHRHIATLWAQEEVERTRQMWCLFSCELSAAGRSCTRSPSAPSQSVLSSSRSIYLKEFPARDRGTRFLFDRMKSVSCSMHGTRGSASAPPAPELKLSSSQTKCFLLDLAESEATHEPPHPTLSLRLCAMPDRMGRVRVLLRRSASLRASTFARSIAALSLRNDGGPREHSDAELSYHDLTPKHRPLALSPTPSRPSLAFLAAPPPCRPSPQRPPRVSHVRRGAVQQQERSAKVLRGAVRSSSGRGWARAKVEGRGKGPIVLLG